MIAIFAVTVVVGFLILLNLMWPFIEGANELSSSEFIRYEGLVHAREQIYENLNDLQDDRDLDKISKDDYLKLQRRLKVEAGEILLALQKVESENEALSAIENEVEKEVIKIQQKKRSSQ